MAAKSEDKTVVTIDTESGSRRLFWLKESGRGELIVSPRNALHLYPGGDFGPNFEGQRSKLKHRKFTVHKLKEGAKQSCISFETNKGDDPQNKALIATSAIDRGQFALVYVYWSGTSNDKHHLPDAGALRYVDIGSFDQRKSALFYSILVSGVGTKYDKKLATRCEVTSIEFKNFNITIFHSIVPVPTIPDGIGATASLIPSELFRLVELKEPTLLENAYDAEELEPAFLGEIVRAGRIIVPQIARRMQPNTHQRLAP